MVNRMMTFFRHKFSFIIFSLFLCVVILHLYDFFHSKKLENSNDLSIVFDVLKSTTLGATIVNNDSADNSLQNYEDRISMVGEISEQDIRAIRTNLEDFGWEFYLKNHQGATPNDLTDREIFCKKDHNSEIELIIDRNNAKQPRIDLTGYASSRLCPKFGVSSVIKSAKIVLHFSLIGVLLLGMILGKIAV